MATLLKKVDVVTVGVGWAGGIVAAECTKAGLKVVGLERGGNQDSSNFAQIHDEWRYGINYGLMQDCSKETVTFRHNKSQKALPYRRMGSFLLGNNTGGAGAHWNGWTFRFMPYDFEIKSLSHRRYGNKLGDDYTLEDWGISYDEMEKYYDRFEKTCGISGEPNPLEKQLGTFRSSAYPQPPLQKTKILKKFEDATKKLGYHPYFVPAANSRDVYTNPDGQVLGQCQYCAFCERFGCEYDAKASPINTVIPAAMASGNYELRNHCNVLEVLTNGDKAVGVRYVDTHTMEEYIQPADIVVLSSYVFNNAKLLMVSNIGTQYDPKTGKGTLGRNYCYQVQNAHATAFFNEQFNIFMGSGALGLCCDDFNGDNFDHSGENFLHGAGIFALQTGARPIQSSSLKLPGGAGTWGADFKRAFNYYYSRHMTISTQGASLPHKENYLSLDPTYKDAYGMPLLRITYNWTNQDRALMSFFEKKAYDIASNLEGVEYVTGSHGITNYSVVPYQSTHNTGGTTMGASPDHSVVNNYLQHWDAHNLFVVSAGNFQHNSGYNPTDTVGALAYRAAEGIVKYYRSGKLLA